MRILWLKTELLHPVDKGGRIRTYHMLKELKRDHHITYLTLDDGTAAADAGERSTEYCHELIRVPHRTRAKFTPGFYMDLVRNLLTPLPYFIMKYESPGMRKQIAEQTNSGKFDVLVCDFLMPGVNVPSEIQTPTVLFQHNVEAMIWKRHYEVQKNPLKKLFLYGQWRKAFAFERQVCRRFDQVVAVSAEDAEQFEREFGISSVSWVPTGVDTEYFHVATNNVVEPHNLVFTGSMDWLPNEDAMQYFIKDILPLIKNTIPDVTLTVVGRRPYPSLVDLSKKDAAITVTGRVDDVRPYMERAAVYIVPLRIGGGTRLKIFEAMAMGKSLVSTTVGAEGLPVKSGRDLILADSPESFAGAVIQLLQNKDMARELGEQAARLVRQSFSWTNAAEKFAEVCHRAARQRVTARQEEQLQPVS